MKRLVIIGGGFAGLWAALVAAFEADKHGAALHVTLISKDDHLTVRPRLYELFTEQFRAPLAPVLSPLGIHLQLGCVESIDDDARTVQISAGDSHVTRGYDKLIVAVGSVQQLVDVPGVAEFALDIDTYAGAEALNEHLKRVLTAPHSTAGATFVVVGGGFTGVELAVEMRNHIRTMSDEATASKARILLIERSNLIGPELGDNPRPIIEAALANAQVEIRLNATLARVEPEAIFLADGERIETSTTMITTGLHANPFAMKVAAERDRLGRLMVDDYLRVNGQESIFAAGDIACAKVDDTRVALMSCQHAIPMGKHAGFNAAHELLDLPLRAYRQPDYVTCLDLGDYGALLTTGWERRVENSGADVKPLKRMINTQWIYPPTGTREDILKASDIDAPWPPAV